MSLNIIHARTHTHALLVCCRVVFLYICLFIVYTFRYVYVSYVLILYLYIGICTVGRCAIEIMMRMRMTMTMMMCLLLLFLENENVSLVCVLEWVNVLGWMKSRRQTKISHYGVGFPVKATHCAVILNLTSLSLTCDCECVREGGCVFPYFSLSCSLSCCHLTRQETV